MLNHVIRVGLWGLSKAMQNRSRPSPGHSPSGGGSLRFGYFAVHPGNVPAFLRDNPGAMSASEFLTAVRRSEEYAHELARLAGLLAEMAGEHPGCEVYVVIRG